MFWVIRGTDPASNEDFSMVVEANSCAAAEAWALKRNVPYIVLDEATEDEIEQARVAQRLWRHTRDQRFMCFGQPIAAGQLGCLMLAGITTIVLLLRSGHVAITF